MGVGTAAWILGSMTFSTTLIMTNKYIMKSYGFNWPITLSAYHFFCTYFLLEIMCRMGLFERATKVPKSACWKNAFFNVCGIVFMNFNLKMNSVGFYQLSKLCCIPVMVIANFILYGKKTPQRTVYALLVLVLGIALFSVNEVSFNVAGSIIAAIAVVFTTASQMNTNIVSNEYSTFGPPMQHATALPMACFGVIASLAMETFGSNSIYLHTFSPAELTLVLLTGGLALISNVCAFALIGKTSAVTYQVVGHAKTIIIFVIGLLFMDSNNGETREQTIKKIFGLVLGMGGTIVYTIFEMQDKAKAKKLEEEKLKNEQDSLFTNEVDEAQMADVIATPVLPSDGFKDVDSNAEVSEPQVDE
jgi:drug/metabolite transporter (DMT)-like permease